jgi:acyl-CoA reductase-like NAD-dependent aldehyde dehydrogenase
VAESWDNGKPVRETLNADLPLAVDHFRYFAGCLRAQEGARRRLMKPPWPITSMNRWAWSGKLFRGTFRC